MPVARFQLPDGRVARFEVPEGTTPAQAQTLIQAQLPSINQPAMPDSLKPTMERLSADAVPGARQLTSGQRVYQAVRPYVAPVVETLGAVGGGLVGGGAGLLGGPVGVAAGGVAGTGLGYAAAKSAVRAADIAFGGQPSDTLAGQARTAALDVAEGATYEMGGRALGPVVGKVAGKVAGKIADLRNIPANKAATIARNALGPDLPEVLNALKAAQGKGVSAAQATADINSPTWQALIDRATARDPRFIAALKASQGDVSLDALAKLAGGTTATETRAAAQTAKNALTEATTPDREAALGRANLGQAVAELEAIAAKLGGEASAKVQEVRDLMKAGDTARAWARLDLIKRGLPTGATKYTHFGELGEKAQEEWASAAANASLDLGQGARFAQSAADELRAVGIKPLESAPLIRSISAIKSNPNFAGDDVLAAAVDNVAQDIAQWTSKGGIVNGHALDAIRKNSINAAIAKLRPGIDATSERNLAAKVLTNIKPLLIDAIESAGGKGYREYLTKYAEGMQKISQQKLTGEALRLWKTDKDAFVRLVQNESPDTVEKFLGPNNYNIAVELSDNAMSVLQDQAKKHLTNLAVERQVPLGQDALKQLLLKNLSVIRLPSYLTALSSTTNKALSILENKMGSKTMQLLTDALQTPEGAQNLLQTLPAEERVRVLQLISNPKQWSSTVKSMPTAAAVGVNALASDQNNANALSNQPARVIQ
jgi:hypothetical protein